jgi:hypothetical protein
VAVLLAVWRRRQRLAAVFFALIVVVFAYTTVTNVIERPDGIKIGGFFIAMIILTSGVSRIWRSNELRVGAIVLDPTAERFISEANHGSIHLLPNGPDGWDPNDYPAIVERHRKVNRVASNDHMLILEIRVSDASEFAPDLEVHGYEVHGQQVLRASSASIANAIAALLLYLRDRTGKLPHAYFGWTEGHPLLELVRYVLLGQGDLAPITHEVLRHAEKDRARRPVIHVS